MRENGYDRPLRWHRREMSTIFTFLRFPSYSSNQKLHKDNDLRIPDKKLQGRILGKNVLVGLSKSRPTTEIDVYRVIRNMWKILAMSALALGLSTPATALIVNETTDFADSLSLTTSIGVLDSGANTVTGEMNGSCDAGGAFCFGGPDRQDGFKFGVAAGHQLTGVFVGTEGSGPTDFTVTAQVWTPSVSMLDSIVLAVNDSGTMPAFAPLSAGTYIFNINGHTFTDPGSFGVVWSARFDVDQINAPATLALLSLGIAGLAYSQRKQVKVV